MSSQGFLFDSDPALLDALAKIPLSAGEILQSAAQPHEQVTTATSPLKSPESQSPFASPMVQSGSSARGSPLETTILGKRHRSISPAVEYFHDLSESQWQLPERRADLNLGSLDTEVYGPAKFGAFGEYMDRKRKKLQIQNAALVQGEDEKPQLFSGIRIYINGHTQPSLQELRTLIMEYGGIFHAYLDRKSLVTHIIAQQLTPAKWKEYGKSKLKIVTPSWLVDSVEQKTLLPWRQYQLRPAEIPRIDGPLSVKYPGTQVGLYGFTQSTSSDPANGSLEPLCTSVPKIRSSPIAPAPTRIPRSPTQSSFDPTVSSVGVPTDSPKTKNNEPIPPDARLTADSSSPASLTHDSLKHSQPRYAPSASNQHAARLMKDPRWRLENTSAGGASFVDGYFRRSRLHYLSTWKSELKTLVKKARECQEGGKDLRPGAESTPHPAHSMLGHSLGVGPKSPTKPSELRTAAAGLPKTSTISGPVTSLPRVIMHCDFDSFFVSASLVTRPALKGLPVVVCHAKGDEHSNVGAVFQVQSTSEVASASYEAREFGIKNGMSLSQAKILCPEIQTVPYEFERYKDYSIKFYSTLLKFADDIEVTSVDEAMIDVSSAVSRLLQSTDHREESWDPAIDLAERIRDEIRRETSCEVSIGVGENMLLARIATKTAKPAGSFHLTQAQALEHLAPLPLSVLPGFGHSTIEKIVSKWGTKTCGEVQEKSEMKETAALQKVLGPGTGIKLWNFVRGIDDRQFKAEEPKKTVSANINYAIRFDNLEQVRTFSFALAKEVSRRLEADSLAGRSLTLRVMRRSTSAPIEAPKFLGHGACDTFHYTTPIRGPHGSATKDADILGAHAWNLINTHHGHEFIDLRGVGISVEKVEAADTTAAEKQTRLSFAPPSSRTLRVSDNKPASTRSLSEIRKEMRRSPSVEPISLTEADPAPKARRVDVRRITKQLAPPRLRLASPTKASIFLKREHTSVNISDVELQDLDIDPEIFHALPPDIQQEQLTHHRILARQSSRASAGPRSPPPSRMPSETPRGHDSRERSASAAPHFPNGIPLSPPQPIELRIAPFVARYCNIPALKKARAAEDLQDLITKWVDSGLTMGPEAAAVSSIRKFFLKCLREEGDLALDKVTTVLTWWQHLCRTHWRPAEAVVFGGEGSMDVEDVGVQWWAAFRQVKTAIDAVVRQRFGGCLSLE